jgi:WD40 repeat protein
MNTDLFSQGEGEGHLVGPIAWSPKNDFVAIANGSVVDIYDVSTGTLSVSSAGITAVVSDAARIVNLAWSPDGTRLATGHFFQSTLGFTEDSSAVQVWDIAPGNIQRTPILTIDGRAGGNMSWSPDGARLAMLGSGELLVYDFVTDQLPADLQFDVENPGDVACSPDGNYVATGGALIRMWDTNTWDVATTIPTESYARTLQWSADGQFLFSDKGANGLYMDALPPEILTTPAP